MATESPTAQLLRLWARTGDPHPGHQLRTLCDTADVLERCSARDRLGRACGRIANAWIWWSTARCTCVNSLPPWANPLFRNYERSTWSRASRIDHGVEPLDLLRLKVGDLGDALLGMALEPTLDGHARQEHVVDEAVGALLGIPHGRYQVAALGRAGRMVRLAVR